MTALATMSWGEYKALFVRLYEPFDRDEHVLAGVAREARREAVYYTGKHPTLTPEARRAWDVAYARRRAALHGHRSAEIAAGAGRDNRSARRER